jgi:hypothetical protein
LSSHKKKLKIRKYKKYIKKYSKEIQKIIGARKGLECWKKKGQNWLRRFKNAKC